MDREILGSNSSIEWKKTLATWNATVDVLQLYYRIERLWNGRVIGSWI
jgi:cAMP phosphodiesterase